MSVRRASPDEQDAFAADSVLEPDRAPSQPWLERSETVPEGSIKLHWISSTALGNERSVRLYRSKAYVPGHPDKILLILFNAEEYLTKIPTPVILDDLMAEGRLPPLAAILIANPTRAARSAELPCNPVFADFLAKGIMALARQEGIAAQAARTIVGGFSYGGLATTCAAFRHPTRFGNVLSLSGSIGGRRRRVTSRNGSPASSRRRRASPCVSIWRLVSSSQAPDSKAYWRATGISGTC